MHNTSPNLLGISKILANLRDEVEDFLIDPSYLSLGESDYIMRLANALNSVPLPPSDAEIQDLDQELEAGNRIDMEYDRFVNDSLVAKIEQ